MEFMTNQKIVEKKSFVEIERHKQEFESLILKRLGICMRHQQAELVKTIVEACVKFHCTPSEYLEELKGCSENSPLFEHLAMGITIGETYFFRDKNQMKLLNDQVLPDIIKRKRNEGNLAMRIWSAGSSSGEEIYTIAMMLMELIPDIHLWTITLLGTDINTKMLKKAMGGCYSEWSMRSIDDKAKQRYFTVKNNQYILSKKIIDFANFSYLNLNEEDYPSIFNGTNAQDLILCRNVLIYFDVDKVKFVMARFYKSLVPEGYLLLGASDPTDNSVTDQVFQHQKGMLFSRSEIDKTPVSTFDVRKIESLPKIMLSPQIISTKPMLRESPQIDRHMITECLHGNQWQTIISIPEASGLNTSDQVFLFNAKALSLANMGKLADAITYSEKSLALEKTNKLTYFTYALVLSELNRISEAESALRRTLFLDNQFVAAYFQLGLLLFKTKQDEAGMKCLQNALSIAKEKNAKEIVPGSSGVSYESFSDILRHEIDIYVELGIKNHENNI
jgi:chemotaxis protein methyltransferase CheR